MSQKSYHIPDSFRQYSREPRPYRARPPAPRTRQPHPAPKYVFLKSTVPQVSKLKPLTRYAPITITPLAKPERRPRTGSPPRGVIAVSKPVWPTQPTRTAASTQPPQPRADTGPISRAQYEAEQRRRQAEHHRQQQVMQREHQRRIELERQRQIENQRQQNRLNLENERRARARAAEKKSAPPTHRAYDLEGDKIELDGANDRAPRNSAPAQPREKSREELKAEIRRKLAAGTLDKDAPDDTAAKSGGCSGNVIAFLIIAAIIWFTVCSGVVDKLLKNF